jgi:hypothetical protein
MTAMERRKKMVGENVAMPPLIPTRQVRAARAARAAQSKWCPGWAMTSLV